MRQIPNQAVDLVARWEGCELTAYKDIVGVWTIGYGSTGAHVKPGLTITQPQARALLRDDLRTAAARLEKVVKAPVLAELTDNQYAALLSFVFNLGATATWTIWKRLNARQFDQVPAEMMKFVNAGGKKVKGLVNRRTDEVRLWSTDEPGSTEDNLPSHVTRSTATPPTPTDPTPPQKSGSLIAGAVSACGAVGVAAKEITETVAPYAAISPLVEQGVTIVASVAAGAAVMALAMTWLKKREARS